MGFCVYAMVRGEGMEDRFFDDLIRRAVGRGYLEFTDGRVVYRCRRRHEENFEDPEERVRAGLFAWLVLEREYSHRQIDVEVTVPARAPGDRADLVLYRDEECLSPYLVVEVKQRGLAESEAGRAVEQVFGYANAMRAAMCWWTTRTGCLFCTMLVLTLRWRGMITGWAAGWAAGMACPGISGG